MAESRLQSIREWRGITTDPQEECRHICHLLQVCHQRLFQIPLEVDQAKVTPDELQQIIDRIKITHL
jgi:hypothetical protein